MLRPTGPAAYCLTQATTIYPHQTSPHQTAPLSSCPPLHSFILLYQSISLVSVYIGFPSFITHNYYPSIPFHTTQQAITTWPLNLFPHRIHYIYPASLYLNPPVQTIQSQTACLFHHHRVPQPFAQSQPWIIIQ